MNRALFWISCLAIAGCAAPGELLEPELDGPGLAGKADGFSSIESAPLAFGEEATAEFTEDFQYFAFEFAAREDATIRAEVTQRGTARGLDSTMFLYRLSDTESPSRIASDDDEGWGALSRIADFRLFSEGRYAIVVGTRGASGRGRFRVTLECMDDACAPPVPAEPLCSADMRDHIEECLAEIGAETGFELPMHEAAADCADELAVGYEDLCDVSSPEPWCEPGRATVVRACEDHLSTSYPSPAALLARVSEVAHPAFDPIVDAAHVSEGCGVSEESGCGVTLTALRYEGEAPSLEEVFALARSRSLIGPGVGTDAEASAGVMRRIAASFDVEDDLAAAIDGLGVDASEAQEGYMFQDGIGWNWGDCQIDVAVAIYPSSHTLVIFDSQFCAG